MAKRWIFYLALNVLVSAVTMLAVLYFWNRAHQQNYHILDARNIWG